MLGGLNARGVFPRQALLDRARLGRRYSLVGGCDRQDEVARPASSSQQSIIISLS